MSDEEGLLAAVWAEPHEDTPRLAYADLLDESGDPARTARAAFIRMQCEFAALDDDDTTRWCALKGRLQTLWEQYGRAFRRGLPDRLRGFPFHRGFVAPVVNGGERKFFTTLVPLLPLAPAWTVTLNLGMSYRVTGFLRSEAFRRVAALQIGFDERVTPALADSPHAVNLAALGIRYTSDRGVGQLAAADNLPHLRRLDLSSCSHVGDGAAAALAASPLAARLTHLDLSATAVGRPGARALAAGGLAQLERLTLGRVSPSAPSGDVVVSALTCGEFPRLRHLRLTNYHLSGGAAEALALWPGAATLRVLDLSGNTNVRAAGVRTLARSRYLQDLERIQLTANAERDEVVTILKGWFGVPYVSTAADGSVSVRRETGR